MEPSSGPEGSISGEACEQLEVVGTGAGNDSVSSDAFLRKPAAAVTAVEPFSLATSASMQLSLDGPTAAVAHGLSAGTLPPVTADDVSRALPDSVGRVDNLGQYAVPEIPAFVPRRGTTPRRVAPLLHGLNVGPADDAKCYKESRVLVPKGSWLYLTLYYPWLAAGLSWSPKGLATWGAGNMNIFPAKCSNPGTLQI